LQLTMLYVKACIRNINYNKNKPVYHRFKYLQQKP